MLLNNLMKTIRSSHRELARVTGLEPAASGVTGRRSNQLSYIPKSIAFVKALSTHMYGKRQSENALFFEKI